MPVKVMFARHKPNHVKMIQEQTFQYKAKQEPESWIHTTYVPNGETLAYVSINITTNIKCFIQPETF